MLKNSYFSDTQGLEGVEGGPARHEQGVPHKAGDGIELVGPTVGLL